MPRHQPPGTPKQLPSGSYSRVVMLGYREDGRRRRTRVTAATPEEVEAKIARLRQQQRDDRLRDSALDKRTVGEHLARWLEDARGTIGHKTWKRHALSVRQLTPLVGRYRLRELRPEHLRAAYRALSRRLAPLSVRHAHAALRLAWKQAQADGLVEHDALAGVRLPRQGRSTAWALTDEEIRRLLAAATTYRTLWLTALYTGCRLGELLALQWADVRWRPDGNAAITVRRALDEDADGHWCFKEFPKSAAGVRTILVPMHVADALRQHAGVVAGFQQHGLVFPTSHGTPYLESNVGHYLARDAAAAGLVWAERRLHCHVCRHTFASHLLAERRPLPEVAYLLGHSSPAVTARLYAHFLGSDYEAAPAALAARYGDAPPLAVVAEPSLAGRNGAAGAVLGVQLHTQVTRLPN